jgi:hypothetical protein
MSSHGLEFKGHAQPLGRRNFLVHAIESIFVATSIPLDEALNAAGAEFQLVNGGGQVRGSPPLGQQGGIIHHFPDAFAGRVEDARHTVGQLLPFNNQIVLVHHCSPLKSVNSIVKQTATILSNSTGRSLFYLEETCHCEGGD